MPDTYLDLYHLQPTLIPFTVERVLQDDTMIVSCHVPPDPYPDLSLPPLGVTLPKKVCDQQVDIPLVPLPYVCEPHISAGFGLSICPKLQNALTPVTTDSSGVGVSHVPGTDCDISIGGDFELCFCIPEIEIEDGVVSIEVGDSTTPSIVTPVLTAEYEDNGTICKWKLTPDIEITLPCIPTVTEGTNTVTVNVTTTSSEDGDTSEGDGTLVTTIDDSDPCALVISEALTLDLTIDLGPGGSGGGIAGIDPAEYLMSCWDTTTDPPPDPIRPLNLSYDAQTQKLKLIGDLPTPCFECSNSLLTIPRTKPAAFNDSTPNWTFYQIDLDRIRAEEYLFSVCCADDQGEQGWYDCGTRLVVTDHGPDPQIELFSQGAAAPTGWIDGPGGNPPYDIAKGTFTGGGFQIQIIAEDTVSALTTFTRPGGPPNTDNITLTLDASQHAQETLHIDNTGTLDLIVSPGATQCLLDSNSGDANFSATSTSLGDAFLTCVGGNKAYVDLSAAADDCYVKCLSTSSKSYATFDSGGGNAYVACTNNTDSAFTRIDTDFAGMHAADSSGNTLECDTTFSCCSLAEWQQAEFCGFGKKYKFEYLGCPFDAGSCVGDSNANPLLSWEKTPGSDIIIQLNLKDAAGVQLGYFTLNFGVVLEGDPTTGCPTYKLQVDDAEVFLALYPTQLTVCDAEGNESQITVYSNTP